MSGLSCGTQRAAFRKKELSCFFFFFLSVVERESEESFFFLFFFLGVKKKKRKKKTLFLLAHVKQQERRHQEQRPPGPPRAAPRVPVPLLPRPGRELRRDAPGLGERTLPRRDPSPRVAAAAAAAGADVPLLLLPRPLPRPQQRRRRHPELHPGEVAHGHVQHPRVPPAFAEVGQRVRERGLGELEADRQRPEQPPVAQEDGLGPPA